jgi:phage terminase large subunit-like protein
MVSARFWEAVRVAEPVNRNGSSRSLKDHVDGLSCEQRAELRALIGDEAWAMVETHWDYVARPEQQAPQGDWSVWLIMAGRGFGKTRAGAEWIDAMARACPGCQIALVGASQQDVREVMIEGPAGLLNIPERGERPLWQPGLKRLVWPEGSLARCFSAAEPEGLRGPQHHFGWADEVARWGTTVGDGGDRAIRAWRNLMLGLRMGDRPQLVATTTPRMVPVITELLKQQGLVRSGGPSQDNAANLSPDWMRAMETAYGDTALGRQELGGELITEVAGALWDRQQIEAARGMALACGDAERLAAELAAAGVVRIVIGVDPPAGVKGDACGIIVAGRCGDGSFVVLDDRTVEHLPPDGWAGAVARAARDWGADRIVAEANNGGEMVRSVLAAADACLPVQLVHASRNKVARAEPVAVHYANGRVRHLGRFARLEDEMCALSHGGEYAGPGRSPDRADALVWALWALMGSAGEPRVRGV